MEKKTILCVEDNPAVQMMNKPLLESKGFHVRMAATIAAARESINHAMPDLIILDIHLPDGNGLDFLRELRKTSVVPVIALTNSKDEQDVLEGLACGCDDYIPKPYSLPILGARIDALIRRAEKLPNVITKGALALHINSNRAYINGVDIGLSPNIEFSLLSIFVKYENKVLSPEFLYQEAWGQPMAGNDNAFRVALSKVRKKIEGSGYTITTERDKGYRFEIG
ncbi:MAG: response regulator transcription factor [Oscillospiraceae bacterium]|nr:response regulator transcription factor [Oscillospiraceae bacterium]